MSIRRTGRNYLVAASIVSSATLAACGGSDDGGRAGGATAAECGEVTLRLSHQWPEPTGEEGDFRSVLAQRFADQVAEETDGLMAVQIFSNSSLVKSTEQYDAMLEGALDMSVFPLAYAAGRVPEFDISAMPAVLRSHEEAQAWEDAEIGQRLEKIMEENGSKVLTWVWNAGAIGAKGDPVVSPDDIRPGMTVRSGFAYHDRMLEAAGAGVSGMPSNEIYSAMQTGVLDAAVTSTGSFASFRLEELVDSYTSPSENTFWFLFEPLIMSTETFDRLCAEQQEAVVQVGEDLQEFAYSASEEDDARVQEIFEEAGVEVVQMDDAAFEQWRELAQDQWAAFAESVEDGQELLDLAKQASGE
jgi:TRAP-type C4-dicarboxylate transport system substrate-binding protein